MSPCAGAIKATVPNFFLPRLCHATVGVLGVFSYSRHHSVPVKPIVLALGSAVFSTCNMPGILRPRHHTNVLPAVIIVLFLPLISRTTHPVSVWNASINGCR